MTPHTDEISRSEEAARAADAKRERLHSLIIVIVSFVIVIVGIAGGIALAWWWIW